MIAPTTTTRYGLILRFDGTATLTVTFSWTAVMPSLLSACPSGPAPDYLLRCSRSCRPRFRAGEQSVRSAQQDDHEEQQDGHRGDRRAEIATDIGEEQADQQAAEDRAEWAVQATEDGRGERRDEEQ